ncbi:AT-hook motif nuclear-localized protein 7 [Oryza brachyantha]|uniref:AT-hook motif nuclear-localized protein 7 n=1 Tax=Oryza brachyantha TaxID=4533 RepID=UPI001ADA919A|nr:AT-hook motif nuclear-localized protein 7 [Oryza brachyantha]
MEGRREGIAVASGHGAAAAAAAAAGFGLFISGADVSPMAEAQEAAAEGYHRSSPSSPSTSPSTPSPRPAAAGHGGRGDGAAATAAAWGLAGEKTTPREAGGDSGVRVSGRHGEHASLSSSGRRRGRPRGSGRRQILSTLGEWYAVSAGGSFTPHVIVVATGEDVAARIMSFSQKGPRSVCILSANGTISSVALNQPGSSGSTFSYEGQFEILQLTGSFTIAKEGGRRRTGGLSVSLAGPDGRVVGGVVAGMLRAASPIQVIVGSFLPNSLKQHQRRMGLHQQPSAAPALPAPMAPPAVLTAAMPISQAAPGNNGCHSPQVSSMPTQSHAGVEHSWAASGAMNLNISSSSTGFSMAGWPRSSQSMRHRPSPDINVCLTPQE